MASSGIIKVAKHIPLIKFPNRLAGASHQHQASSSSSSGSGSRPKGSGIEEWSLPLRFRRKPISQEEIDYICRGGPE